MQSKQNYNCHCTVRTKEFHFCFHSNHNLKLHAWLAIKSCVMVSHRYMQYDQTEAREIIIFFVKNLSVILTLGLTACFGWQ